MPIEQAANAFFNSLYAGFVLPATVPLFQQGRRIASIHREANGSGRLLSTVFLGTRRWSWNSRKRNWSLAAIYLWTHKDANSWGSYGTAITHACENALEGPVLLDMAKPSTRQVEMLAPPALRLSHLAHLIGAKFVGRQTQSLTVLHDKTSQKKETSLHSHEVTGQNDLKLRRSNASAVILRMNSNISDLPMAVIRATRPDATGVRAAQIIGGLGVGKYLRDLKRFHLRASTLASGPVVLGQRGNSHRASHGSGESCAGGGILSAEAREQPQNRWWISQLQTRSEFRFLITRSTTTVSCCSWNGICTGSKHTGRRSRIRLRPVIPVQTSALSVVAEWLDKQILWAGKLTDKERGEPANAWRLRQFETRLDLLPGSFGPQVIRGHLNQSFEKNLDKYLEDLVVYREEDPTHAHSLLIPLDHPTLAQVANWMTNKMKWWRGLTDRAKAMPHNQWRIQQLKTKIGLPFAEL